MKRVDLAIFDLDNTLYDWYSAFIPAFYGMVDEAVAILKCDREELLDQLRDVHVRNHDVEHPYSLFETPIAQSLLRHISRDELWKLLDPAFHAFNRIRKQRLTLYPDTLETLDALKRQKIKLVAFTDSKYFAALGRVERLGLADHFLKIYCRERSVTDSPSPRNDRYLRFSGMVEELPPNELKPSPEVLRDIAQRESVPITSAVYVGDSIAKDMLMAQRAGCFSVWAKFGAHVDNEMYDSLVRISHWSAADVARERRFAREAHSVAPDFICEKSIAEILKAITGPSDNH